MSDKSPFAGWPNTDWTKDVAKFWSQAMPKPGAGGGEFLERLQAISRDNMAFVEDRMRKDMDVARQITEAKSPTDVMRIQMEFFQTLVSDYNRQAMRMAEEAGKALTSGLGNWPGMPGKK